MFLPVRSLVALVASGCLFFGLFFASVVFRRWEPILNQEEQFLLASTSTTTSAFSGTVSQLDNDGLQNKASSHPSCWNRSPPFWPRSMVVTQKRVPDSDSRVGPATTITYYDYERGGNLILVIPDSNDERKKKGVLWDLELNSGHSYYFYPSEKSCKAVDMPVGILRPEWLEGATPLGPSWSTWRRSKNDESKSKTSLKEGTISSSDRLVCGWTKADFIDYYEDASTGEPDSWYFHNMKATFRVLNYTADAMIEPYLFVPPDYCFS